MAMSTLKQQFLELSEPDDDGVYRNGSARRMARTNLANPPFCMGAEAVEAAWRAACDQDRANDVRRIEATNGAVYFYSTDYLSPARARSLAQYDAVERAFNV